MRWLAVADDLSGAADLAGRLSGRGEGIWIARSAADLRGLAGSRVLDVEGRFVGPAECARRTGNAWASLESPRGPFLRFQKIDSTLRGNPAEECGALALATAAPWVAVQPAYPSQGRIVRGGTLWVHGRRLDQSEYAADPLSPSRASGPAALFPRALSLHVPLRAVCAGAGALRLWLQRRRGRARFVTFDCVSDADMDAAARACLGAGCRHFAGASGLGAALATALDGAPRGVRRPAGLPWMVLAGSVSERSFAQLASLDPGVWTPLRRRRPAGGWDLLGRRERPELRRRLRRQGALALSSLASRADLRHWRLRQGRRAPEAVAEEALEGLARAGLDVAGGLAASGWFLTGGHTLAVFCRLAGLRRLEVLGLAAPGVPLSRAEGPGGRAWLASKPGGFGTPRLLADFLGRA